MADRGLIDSGQATKATKDMQGLMMSDAEKTAITGQAKSGSRWKIQLGVLCGMILLALIGMGLTQAYQGRGVWEYWLFVIIVYAGLGLWRSTRKAKLDNKPVKELVARELAHWATLLAFIGVVLLLEQREMINRESASDVSLMR